jgi:hypothetical protein
MGNSVEMTLAVILDVSFCAGAKNVGTCILCILRNASRQRRTLWPVCQCWRCLDGHRRAEVGVSDGLKGSLCSMPLELHHCGELVTYLRERGGGMDLVGHREKLVE